MAAQSLAKAQGGFQVDEAADREALERRDLQRFLGDVGVETVGVKGDGREADAVHGDALPELEIRPWQAR